MKLSVGSSDLSEALGRIGSLPPAGLTAVAQFVAVTPSRPLSAALAAPPLWRLLLALRRHVTLPCQDFLQGVTPFRRCSSASLRNTGLMRATGAQGSEDRDQEHFYHLDVSCPSLAPPVRTA